MLTGRYFRCMNEPLVQMTLSSKNSPGAYCQRILDCDYGLESEETAESLEYFKYGKDKGRLKCQRFLCQDCHEFNGDVVDKKAFRCPFCKDICNCRGCCLGEEIVKQLALLKHLLMRYNQPLTIYE